MTRFALTIEYDGGPYWGWQRQSGGPSVQQSIEEAIAKITSETVNVYAAGRTDAGVHALAMCAHVDIEKAFQPFRLMAAINAHLRPQPIAIRDCKIVPDDWHARHSCIRRSYEYRITNRAAPLALEQGKAWRIAKPLDAEAMHDAAQILVGLHDFTTFRSVHCQSASPIKSLDRLDVHRDGEHVLIEASARSFLHHQVRSMVGCLSFIGTGKWTKADLKSALEACDRGALALNAPPDGLYFMGAEYPD
jgi:tRNA pseudouridine38-40 synthase